MLKMVATAVAAAVLIGAAGFAVGQMMADPVPGLFPYEDAERVANGAALYAENCASCHGEQLEGQPDWKQRDADGYLPAPPHDAAGHTWHHPDEQLLAIVTLGTEAIVGGGYKSNMQGFGDVLSEDEILDVMAYIKSTWPEQVVATHNEINARASAYE